uniref:ubiquitinyl hydrolase 1 n=1 Tax=Melopsittacus undulatus TaxID=13146 RepID=A0A8V5GRV4_MELUD
YHERQRLQLCAVHALNNLLQRQCLSRGGAEDICKRPLERLVLPQIFGFILNVPSGPLLGLLPVPARLRRQHWLSLRCFQGVYYNLDSKLPQPQPIGGEEELRAFLQDFLSQGLSELFLVVPHDVEESRAWLSAE